jgi:uncharacterized repeat protein (TIGR04052 family)
MRRLTILSMAIGVLAAGCDDEAAQPEAVTLQFAASFGDSPALCGGSYPGVGTSGATVEVRDLRFFVSDVELVTEGGEAVPLAMDLAAPWQDGEVALVDLEDGSAGCAESGNAALNARVTGTVPAGDYTGLRFRVGVPEDANHQDTGKAAPPLDVTPMFWVWQSGYKFLRVDLGNGTAPPSDRWNIHLGATGCVSESPVTAPELACAKPNRPLVTLSGFDPRAGTVVLDIAALVAAADVSVNTAETAPGCMSGANDATECAGVFANLGLDFQAGDCLNGCSGQSAFRAQATR